MLTREAIETQIKNINSKTTIILLNTFIGNLRKILTGIKQIKVIIARIKSQ
jgi:hypothetical protein